MKTKRTYIFNLSLMAIIISTNTYASDIWQELLSHKIGAPVSKDQAENIMHNPSQASEIHEVVCEKKHLTFSEYSEARNDDPHTDVKDLVVDFRMNKLLSENSHNLEFAEKKELNSVIEKLYNEGISINSHFLQRIKETEDNTTNLAKWFEDLNEFEANNENSLQFIIKEEMDENSQKNDSRREVNIDEEIDENDKEKSIELIEFLNEQIQLLYGKTKEEVVEDDKNRQRNDIRREMNIHDQELNELNLSLNREIEQAVSEEIRDGEDSKNSSRNDEIGAEIVEEEITGEDVIIEDNETGY